MREWRPLHRGIITSDKLGVVGDAAFRLFMYLLVAQDDDGNYPWTRIKRNTLTVGTGWSDTEAVALADELVAAGLCEIDGEMLQIVNGAEMQGKRRGDVKAFRYEQSGHVTSTPRARPVNDSTTLHNSRGHNSRGQDTAPGASAPAWVDRLSRHPTVAAALPDQEWIEQIETDFSDVDLESNAVKFVDWWTDSPRSLKRWKVAWRSWCERAKKDAMNGRESQKRAGTGIALSGPDRPKSAGFPV